MRDCSGKVGLSFTKGLGMAEMKRYESPEIREFGSIDLTLGRRGSYPDGRSMNVMTRPKSMRGGNEGHKGGDDGDDGGDD